MALKASMRILLVDPNSNIRMATRQMFNKIGFKNIKECDGAESAIKMLESAVSENENFEFIVLEWDLPKMSGLDFIKHLRADEHYANVPMLLATGDAEQNTIVSAAKAGVNNFMVKPFSLNMVQEKIGAIFNKKKKSA